MSGRVLLDTNIVIALFQGDNSVEQRLSAVDEVFLSSIVLGELYFGALKSSRTDENVTRVEEFASVCSLLACDQNTAREYGKVKEVLRAKGKPIPENDVWVAAVAQQHELTLITRDLHFDELDGLNQEQW